MIPLVSPTVTVHDRARMLQALGDGLLENEDTVTRFEEAFAARVNCRYAVAVNSGTTALTIALHALAINSGDEVSIPSYGCMAVRNAVHARQARAHYVDTTFNVQIAQGTFEWMWPDNSILVHHFGRPTLIAPGPVLVEDYTLSLGAIPHLTGDLGVCSTHASKMISTGRGGVVFGNNESLLDWVRELAHYETHTSFGYSAGMSSTQAQLGLSQLEQLDHFIELRRDLARFYTERFRGAGIECPDPDSGSAFFRYMIAVDDPADKVTRLAEKGIEAGRGVNPPLHRLAGLPDKDFPGTTLAVERLLSVPVHPGIGSIQAVDIVEAVLEVCAP